MRAIDIKAFFSILFLLLTPNLYLVIRVNFLGDLPDDSGINISSQLSWVSLLYEVVNEALLLPLYCLISKSIDKPNELRNKICSGYIVIITTYLLFSITVATFASPLCKLMAQKPELIAESISYIRLETVASLFSTLLKYNTLLLILLNKTRIMNLVVVLQTSLAVLFDTIFISQLRFSLKLGVNGIAISNIFTYAIVALVTISLLNRQFKISFKNLSYTWLKEWINLGKYSGFESLVRNLSFSFMIIRMVNLVQEQGNYWIANNFIWGFMLMPIIALSEIIRKEAGRKKLGIKTLMSSYIKVSLVIIAIWILSMPSWEYLLKNLMNVQDYTTVLWLIRFQLVFYIIFAFNNIMSSVLYGLGKHKYLFYRSICIDVVYYGIVYILYLNDIFVPSLKTVSIMFGLGIILNNIPTIYFYKKATNEDLSYN